MCSPVDNGAKAAALVCISWIAQVTQSTLPRLQRMHVRVCVRACVIHQANDNQLSNLDDLALLVWLTWQRYVTRLDHGAELRSCVALILSTLKVQDRGREGGQGDKASAIYEARTINFASYFFPPFFRLVYSLCVYTRKSKRQHQSKQDEPSSSGRASVFQLHACLFLRVNLQEGWE